MPPPTSPRRSPRSAVVGSAAVLVLGAVVLAGCSASGNPVGSRGTGNQAFVAGTPGTTVVPVADRKPAPALVGTTLSGGTFDLASTKGKVVVLNVWASWCAPCRAESPGLEVVHTATADKGVVFVGLDTRDSDAAAKAFVANIGSTYPHVVDPDGELLLAFRDLPPSAVPSTLVLDRQGRIAARVVGPVTEPRLMTLLAPLVAEKA